MDRETVYIIRDDYDQSTVCVVHTDNERYALDAAYERYGDDAIGELYAVESTILITV